MKVMILVRLTFEPIFKLTVNIVTDTVFIAMNPKKFPEESCSNHSYIFSGESTSNSINSGIETVNCSIIATVLSVGFWVSES